jgi:hypothetical protein
VKFGYHGPTALLGGTQDDIRPTVGFFLDGIPLLEGCGAERGDGYDPRDTEFGEFLQNKLETFFGGKGLIDLDGSRTFDRPGEKLRRESPKLVGRKFG